MNAVCACGHVLEIHDDERCYAATGCDCDLPKGER